MAFSAQTLAAVAGTDGRVRQTDNSQIIAGIDKWERTGQATIIPYPHFESETEANTNLVKPNKLRGLGDDKFNVHGWYNLNIIDGTEVVGGTEIINGAYVTMDFIVSKETSQGYANVSGWIANLNVTVDENNKVAEFTATLDVDGVITPFGIVV